MQHAASSVHLLNVPAGFRYSQPGLEPQPMPEYEQHKAAVAGFGATALDSSDQPFHFETGEVFAVVHHCVESLVYRTARKPL